MSLREDAIKQFEDKKAERAAKEKAEREDAIKRRVEYATKSIRENFGLLYDPELTLEEVVSRYYPNCSFQIDGIRFVYDLDTDNAYVEIECPKCNEARLSRIGIRTHDGKTDLSSLGGALASSHNGCPKDQVEAPALPPPRPAPKTVEYSINSAEYRLLEALDDLIAESIED